MEMEYSNSDIRRGWDNYKVRIYPIEKETLYRIDFVLRQGTG